MASSRFPPRPPPVPDLLRLLCNGDGVIGAQQRADIQDLVLRVQASRDSLVRATWRRTTQAFSVDTLVSTLLLAGMVTPANGVKAMLKHALQLCIMDASTLKYFLNRVDEEGFACVVDFS